MDKKTKTLERLITQKPEEYKEESTETRPEDIKIVWGTSGEYQTGLNGSGTQPQKKKQSIIAGLSEEV